MHNIFRFYNRNRRIIWLICIAIVFVILMIQALNQNYKDTNNKGKVSSNSDTIDIRTNEIAENVIKTEQINSNDSKKTKNVINEYIDYCNLNEIEQAYTLISDECKELLYPTINDFSSRYFSKIFNNVKTYKIERIMNETYQVTLVDNVLSTGNANNATKIVDYFTIIRDGNNEKKLNINSFISRKKLNGILDYKNIQFIVIYKDVYMDYEIYNIEVKNNRDNDILLDSKQSSKTVFLLDENNSKYNSALNETDITFLRVRINETKRLKIKFYKIYNTTRKITTMEFTDIILDCENYINRVQVSIDI